LLRVDLGVVQPDEIAKGLGLLCRFEFGEFQRVKADLGEEGVQEGLRAGHLRPVLRRDLQLPAFLRERAGYDQVAQVHGGIPLVGPPLQRLFREGFAVEGVEDAVEDGRLALGVAAADDDESALGVWDDLDGGQALDVFGLEFYDLHGACFLRMVGYGIQ
jgi:hypothetical protein